MQPGESKKDTISLYIFTRAGVVPLPGPGENANWRGSSLEPMVGMISLRITSRSRVFARTGKREIGRKSSGPGEGFFGMGVITAHLYRKGKDDDLTLSLKIRATPAAMQEAERRKTQGGNLSNPGAEFFRVSRAEVTSSIVKWSVE
jgi:hypothetical protein